MENNGVRENSEFNYYITVNGFGKKKACEDMLFNCGS
jgi:hypothetical protein